MESPISQQLLVVCSRGNSSPKAEEKENCTEWSFWVQILVLVWLVVIVAELDGVVVLEHNILVLLKALAPLTY